MPLNLEKQGLAIVLTGKFNPAIFQPWWFCANELIPRQEVNAATTKIVHEDVTVFHTDWLELFVDRDKFQAGTPQEAFFEPLRDLVKGTFELLSHTPLQALGINCHFHYTLDSDRVLEKLFGLLAPSTNWQGTLQHPRMMTLIMQGKRPDELPGSVQVKVEPSIKVSPGVFVDVNDHYELRDPNEQQHSEDRFLEILDDRFEHSLRKASEVAEKILKIGE